MGFASSVGALGEGVGPWLVTGPVTGGCGFPVKGGGELLGGPELPPADVGGLGRDGEGVVAGG